VCPAVVTPFVGNPAPVSASVHAANQAQSMLVPLKSTGAGSRSRAYELPMVKPLVRSLWYQVSDESVSFCPAGPNARRLWSEYVFPALSPVMTQTVASPFESVM